MYTLLQTGQKVRKKVCCWEADGASFPRQKRALRAKFMQTIETSEVYFETVKTFVGHVIPIKIPGMLAYGIVLFQDIRIRLQLLTL
jgi:hypothetical protein